MTNFMTTTCLLNVCENKFVHRPATRYLIFVLFSVQVFVSFRLLEVLSIMFLKALSVTWALLVVPLWYTQLPFGTARRC